MNRGLLLVLSGPSGVGKGTICAEYCKRAKNTMLSVSVTERKPRVGEVHGQHYYFISKEEFDDLIKNDGLIEWAQYGENRYGTPKEPVMRALEEGKNVILEIEVVGAMKVRAHYPEGVYIFVTPPSLDVLRCRLEGRHTETKEQIAARFAKAMVEFGQLEKYNYIIENDNLESAVTALTEIINAERMRTERCLPDIKRKLML